MAKVRTKKRGQAEWLEIVSSGFEDDRKNRSSLEREWMVNVAYYKGMQNIKYDPQTQKLTFDNRDPLRFYVNKIMPTVRAIRAVITRNNPVWDIDAIPIGTLGDTEIRILNEFMVALYEKLGLKETLKETVYYALLMGLGVIQYGFEAAKEGDKDQPGELWVESLDPFDVYFGGPAATSVHDADRITKVVRRSREWLKEKEDEGIYKNVSKLETDNKVSESPYKQLLETQNSEGAFNEDGTVLIKETWVREGGQVFVVTWSGGVVLRVEKSEFTHFPFVLYKPDITPNQIYNEGWVTSLIPLNKAINYLERKRLQYNVTQSVGMWVTDSGSAVKKFNNSNGQIIKVGQGRRFEQLRQTPLNSTVERQLIALNREFSDISGVQEALLGRAPSGVTAAVAFEELVANSISNMADLIDNMVITLEELGNDLLTLAREKYTLTKEIKVQNADGKGTVVKIGGAKAMISENDEDAVRLPEKPVVRVKITEGVAHTRQGKQSTLFQLRAQRDVDRRTVLESFGLDATEIERRLSQEAQGIPITEAPEEEGVETQEPVEEEIPQEEIPSGTGPSDEELLTAFAEEAAAQGITISQELANNPDLLLQVINGEVPSIVTEDGVLELA